MFFEKYDIKNLTEIVENDIFIYYRKLKDISSKIIHILILI